MNSVTDVRKSADDSQINANEKMLKTYARKNPVSVYNIGETVVVANANAKTKRGKIKIGEQEGYEGVVIANKGLNYQISYETDTGKMRTEWFPVSQITSRTKDIENKREKVVLTQQPKKVVLTQQPMPISESSESPENNRNNQMTLLRERLQAYDLVPEETSKDGNCFFRAVSRLVYTSDEHHLSIRERAVEAIRMNPERYQNYVLHDHQSVEDYCQFLEQDGNWADDAAVAATADALEITIQVVSSNNAYMPIQAPEVGVSSQTIFLGLINDYHFMSTANSHLPQMSRPGGVTDDGVGLQHTDGIDHVLTWLFHFFITHKEMKTSKAYTRLQSVFNTFQNGNSANAKRTLIRTHLQKKNKKNILTGCIPCKQYSDDNVLENVLDPYKFKWEIVYGRCSDTTCGATIPTKEKTYTKFYHDTIEELRKLEMIKCPSCNGTFTGINEVTMASPFLLISGRPEETEISKYHNEITFSSSEEDLLFHKMYLSEKSFTEKHSYHHYTSYFKHNNYWFEYNPIRSIPLKKLVTPPDCCILGHLSCVVYVCLALLLCTSGTANKKKNTKIPNKSKKITTPKRKHVDLDVISGLKLREGVQLVRFKSIYKYVEFRRDKKGEQIPELGDKYLEKLSQEIQKDGLQYPVVLAVSKKTGRAYVYEGNHRLAVLKKHKVEWVPVMCQYFFLNDDYDKRYKTVPKVYYDSEWPRQPTAEDLGFETKQLP